MQTHSFYRILMLIGFLCTVAVVPRARGGTGDGGGVVARAILDGSKNQVHADSSRTVEDSAFFNATTIGNLDTGYSVQNIITLKINEASPVYLRTAFTVTAQLRIIFSNGSSIDSIDRPFTINYD